MGASNGLAWIAIGISALALVSTWVFNLATLRRAKRGPAPTARWQLQRERQYTYLKAVDREMQIRNTVLVTNAGSGAARDVRLGWAVPPAAVHGPDRWAAFDPGATAVLDLIEVEEAEGPVIQLTWARPWWRRGREQWTSELPP